MARLGSEESFGMCMTNQWFRRSGRDKIGVAVWLELVVISGKGGLVSKYAKRFAGEVLKHLSCHADGCISMSVVCTLVGQGREKLPTPWSHPSSLSEAQIFSLCFQLHAVGNHAQGISPFAQPSNNLRRKNLTADLQQKY